MEIVKVVLATLVRFAGVCATYWGYLWADRLWNVGGDDPLGAGFLGLYTIMGVTFVWGVVDGLRLPPLRWAVAWPGAAVLASLATSVSAGLAAGAGAGWMLQDFLSFGTVVVGLIAVPPAVGAGTGAVVRSSRDTRARRTGAPGLSADAP